MILKKQEISGEINQEGNVKFVCVCVLRVLKAEVDRFGRISGILNTAVYGGVPRYPTKEIFI